MPTHGKGTFLLVILVSGSYYQSYCLPSVGDGFISTCLVTDFLLNKFDLKNTIGKFSKMTEDSWDPILLR